MASADRPQEWSDGSVTFTRVGDLEHRHADVGHDVYLSTMSQEFL